MSTYSEAYCNTTTDLQVVEPNIDAFDQKRAITGVFNISQSGGTATVYTYNNVGFIGALYRDSKSLGAAQATAAAVDGAVDGEWHYDTATDVLTLASIANPDTAHQIEAGRDWATLKTEAVNRASDMVRSIAGKPIMQRTGTGVQSETLRDFEDIIIRSAAHLAVADMVRPYDFDRAAQIQSIAHNPEATGWLDMIRKGEIALWNESSPELNQGRVRIVAQNASSTGTIMDVEGVPSIHWDAVKVVIVTGGTFSPGSASTVTYSVYVANSTGIKTSAVVTAQIITGSYQTLAHGLSLRFGPGIYTANDEWEVEVRGDPAESGIEWGSYSMTRL